MPLKVKDLIKQLEFFPKDAYIVNCNDKFVEIAFYTRELDKAENEGGQYVDVVRIV